MQLLRHGEHMLPHERRIAKMSLAAVRKPKTRRRQLCAWQNTLLLRVLK